MATKRRLSPRDDSEPARPPSIAEADVAAKAFELLVARGGEAGRDLDDWLEAERLLGGSPPAARGRRGRTLDDEDFVH